jgi:hypothetical protein
MNLPHSRGVICDALRDCFTGVRDCATLADLVDAHLVLADEVLHDDDLQAALFILYELHYTGFCDVAEDFEWNPDLLRARALIEERFEDELRRVAPVPVLPDPHVEEVASALFALTAPTGGASLSRYVAKIANDEQLHELLIQRSLYQLKEADPHTWAIPRLAGRPKAALVEVQTDEYGNGRPEQMHSALFAQTMTGLALDSGYGSFVDRLPAITLASLNMMSMFGLHRRLRGAIVGHLTAFEMTSSIPNRFYGDGFRRLGYDAEVTLYFDEHVEADAVHEQIAGRDLAGALAEAEPNLLPDIMFGAAACLHVDGLVARHILECWQRGESSLRPVPRADAVEGHVGGRLVPGYYHG